MAAPTFVASYLSALQQSTTQNTVALTNATDDVLVCCAVTDDSPFTLTAPTGGTGLTWTLRQSVVVTNYCATYIWTATATAANTAATITVTISNTGGRRGFEIYRFSGSAGIGGSNKANSTSSAPTAAVTNTGDNSAMVVLNTDWNAVDGASRTWRTINGLIPAPGGTGGTPANNGYEQWYDRVASGMTVYSAYYPDCGAQGSKTVGLTAPATQEYGLIGVEVLGTAAAAQYVQRAYVAPSQAAHRAASW